MTNKLLFNTYGERRLEINPKRADKSLSITLPIYRKAILLIAKHTREMALKKEHSQPTHTRVRASMCTFNFGSKNVTDLKTKQNCSELLCAARFINSADVIKQITSDKIILLVNK